MGLIHIVISVVFVLLVAPVIFADTPTDPVLPGDAVYQVHVTSVVLDPPVFFPYETGTVTVNLTNSGNQTVTLSNPTILDTHIREQNGNSYGPLIYLGPGNSISYSFLVSPDTGDGTYFPLFTVSTVEAGSISYPFQFEVDSRNLSVIVVDKPDNFSLETKDNVTLGIVNPRDGPVRDIMVSLSGSGFDIIPARQFISSLDAGSSREVTFQVTPHRAAEVLFHVTYDIGNNGHSTDLVLPLNLGADKLAAVPVINNIALAPAGAGYQLTGDVSNAGITDASGVVLTVITPARPIEPYTKYAVGALASGDFSSFTLTFSAGNLTAVPVEVTWKDADGNSFSTVQTLDLRLFVNTTAGSRPPGIFSFGSSSGDTFLGYYLVIAGAIVLVIGMIIWRRKRHRFG